MKMLLSLLLALPVLSVASTEFRALNLGDRLLDSSRDFVKNYDFVCVDSRTFKTADSAWETQNKTYPGTGAELKINENHEVFVEEASDQSWKDVTIVKTTKLDEVTLSQIIETETTTVDNDKTTTTKQLIQRSIKIENGVKKIVSNKVDGVETLFPWDKYNVDLPNGDKIFTRIHTSPSEMNKDGKEYSRRFETCVYSYP